MIRRREKPVILYHLYNAKDEYGQPRLEWDEKITTSGLYIIKGIFTRMSPEYEDIDGTLLLKESTFGPDWLVSIDDKNYRIQYVYPQMNCNRYTSYYLKSTTEEPTQHLEFGVYYKVEEYETWLGETRYKLFLRNTPEDGYSRFDVESPEVDPPWVVNNPLMNIVTVEEEIAPTTLYRWFDGSLISQVTGLEKIDLTQCRSLKWAFRACNNLEGTIKFSTSAPLNTSLRSTFKECYNLYSADVSGLCSSNCTSLNSIFHSCRNLKSVTGLETFDTSNCTEINSMFTGCQELIRVDGVANWDTRNVTTFNSAFNSCGKLPFIDISGWRFDSATSVSNLFNGCQQCKSINIKNFTPPPTLTTMAFMFRNCQQLWTINCDDITCTYPEGCTVGNVFQNCNNLPNYNWECLSADYWGMYVVNNANTCPILTAVATDSNVVFTFDNPNHITYTTAILPDWISYTYDFLPWVWRDTDDDHIYGNPQSFEYLDMNLKPFQAVLALRGYLCSHCEYDYTLPTEG